MQPTAMPSQDAGFWTPSRALNTLTIDRFLPLSRMKELTAPAHSTYISAAPFPHIVLDDFFDPDLIDLVLSEFPKPGDICSCGTAL